MALVATQVASTLTASGGARRANAVRAARDVHARAARDVHAPPQPHASVPAPVATR